MTLKKWKIKVFTFFPKRTQGETNHRMRRNKLEKSLLTQTSTTHPNKKQQALLDLQAHVFGRERSISSFMRVKLYCIEDSNLGLRSSESRTSVKCLGGGR